MSIELVREYLAQQFSEHSGRSVKRRTALRLESSKLAELLRQALFKLGQSRLFFEVQKNRIDGGSKYFFASFAVIQIVLCLVIRKRKRCLCGVGQRGAYIEHGPLFYRME